MPSRRSHKKSRLGCDTCRARRVKCDEQGPPCSSCVARKVDCTYLKRDGKIGLDGVRSTRPRRKSMQFSPEPPPTPINNTSLKNTPTEGSGRSPLTSQAAEVSRATSVELDNPLGSSSRLQELSLMRWWCMHSCRSLVRKNSLDVDIWLGPVVDLALKYSWVMDVILALSATQIAAESHRSALRSAYASLALEYQSRAVAAARPHLQNIGADNCHALFAFTLLNIPTSIILAQLPIGSGEVTSSPVESIIISAQWIESLVSLMERAGMWLSTGCFRPAFNRCDDPTMYDEAYRPAMQRLLSLLMQSKYTGREHTKQFYLFSRAIELLETYFLREKNMAIGWPAELGHAFIEHVQAKNSMALLLTMHWGVLMHSLEMWWGVFTGKRLVDQIGRELSTCDCGKTREAIHWARVQVGLDIQKTWNQE